MEVLLQIRNLKKYFPITKGIITKKQLGVVKAVDGVGFEVYQGETLGLVGESGCGKSTTGRCILRLIEPTAGEVHFDGVNIGKLDKQAMRRIRKDMQMVFQAPFASLNPRMKIGDIIMEPILLHGIAKGKEARNRVKDLLNIVGLAGSYTECYPHEFSDGQRQRIGIARALAVEPKMIIFDEPVSALDVSIRAQVINLIKDLQEQYKLTYIFIAHDLSVVHHISDRVAVMYLGRIVEITGYRELYQNPCHPYTKALISAIPIPDPNVKKEKLILKSDVINSLNQHPGCNFYSRCPYSFPRCREEVPELRETRDGHSVACHLVNT
ncbi:ABC transporter ATP-binding protein [Phosphitispora sp. TUW77]|uniref:ABC transporter ATP-binding protein n=1 Tax=Phosphitispora sp. TUW77 TaxID=3152361 RepID=UPI003AB62383